MSKDDILASILAGRGLAGEVAEQFLHPDYGSVHDPFLLPDMHQAVDRIKQALDKQEAVVIYGDYDIDGITATAILLDGLTKMSLKVDAYTPNRFTEGYGLNVDAIKALAKTDAKLVITVDCGSLSHEEIKLANELGLDVIVTDHHAVADDLPQAIAVVNPHREDNQYPFADLAGCGVAFKLVQALQTELVGLPKGQEKWLLDLVALGTVCDIVPLVGENRVLTYWGIEVMKKTRHLGLKALMAVTKMSPVEVDSRKIGFVLGPRLNAAGRLDTAQHALELLTTTSSKLALELANRLDGLNRERRIEQDRIFAEAAQQLEGCKDDVLVVGDGSWNEGVIGIVASKLMEKYDKPTFVLSMGEQESKGSGRSFGDFNMAEAIDATRSLLLRGGGHAAAGGVTLKTSKVDEWRAALGDFYRSLKLKDQKKYLLASEDIRLSSLEGVDISLVDKLAQLEPFGMGNEKPVFHLEDVQARFVDKIGKGGDHLKLTVADSDDNSLKFLAFSPPSEWFVEPGSKVSAWVNLEVNEWNGNKTVEGRILRLELL
ncbi:MAG: single-stranded-DNA-specific exonuclease RecJ [Candidatus Nomurabacteria bacterium]|jgi:single-stranded-DNA-specific exonuclease|nr:single-stranded-DNA-specific exonuclease RecJ [Candidatus Nomurabacteria bacterium]